MPRKNSRFRKRDHKDSSQGELPLFFQPKETLLQKRKRWYGYPWDYGGAEREFFRRMRARAHPYVGTPKDVEVYRFPYREESILEYLAVFAGLEELSPSHRGKGKKKQEFRPSDAASVLYDDPLDIPTTPEQRIGWIVEQGVKHPPCFTAEPDEFGEE